MQHSTRHVRGARALFAMWPSYSGLVHYIASSTIDGAPVKRGVLPLALASQRMSRRIGQMDPN